MPRRRLLSSSMFNLLVVVAAVCPGSMIRDEPEFVATTPVGAVLSGLKPPDEARERLEIGNAEDAKVGEEAVLHSSWKV